MTQPSLFPVTVSSPFCVYTARDLRCRHGRAVYGPEEPREGCVNRRVRCLTCHAHGEESRRQETR